MNSDINLIGSEIFSTNHCTNCTNGQTKVSPRGIMYFPLASPLVVVYFVLTIFQIWTQHHVQYTEDVKITPLLKEYRPKYPKLVYHSLIKTSLEYRYTNGTHARPFQRLDNVTTHALEIDQLLTPRSAVVIHLLDLPSRDFAESRLIVGGNTYVIMQGFNYHATINVAHVETEKSHIWWGTTSHFSYTLTMQLLEERDDKTESRVTVLVSQAPVHSTSQYYAITIWSELRNFVIWSVVSIAAYHVFCRKNDLPQ
jgi:hypothetical protein